MMARKGNRLGGYDYSQAGAYFITICAKDNAQIFGKIPVGAAPCRPVLSHLGKLTEAEILCLAEPYDDVSLDCYVIMPNHVHMVIAINAQGSGRQGAAPTVSRVVEQLKEYTTKTTPPNGWRTDILPEKRIYSVKG